MISSCASDSGGRSLAGSVMVRDRSAPPSVQVYLRLSARLPTVVGKSKGDRSGIAGRVTRHDSGAGERQSGGTGGVMSGKPAAQREQGRSDRHPEEDEHREAPGPRDDDQ